MFSQELELPYCKVMKMKYPKSNSIHRVTRSSQQVVTKVDEVYTELIQLRNKNRALEGRIKQLENQNFDMT
jgi:cell division protein FtsB